jgi:hypothetical protein
VLKRLSLEQLFWQSSLSKSVYDDLRKQAAALAKQESKEKLFRNDNDNQ